jgi:hypothetical protein
VRVDSVLHRDFDPAPPPSSFLPTPPGGAWRVATQREHHRDFMERGATVRGEQWRGEA